MKDEFEKQARFFDLGQRYFWLSAQNRIVGRTLAPYLARRRPPGARPLRILDIGCGPGNTLSGLRRWGTVIGADFSLDALAFARTKGVTRVLSCDSVALPFATATLDCVVALDVLEHVEDDQAALSEIARVLSRGGVFVFTVPASMALWRHHDVMYGHYRRYTKRQFTERVSRAGLVIDQCCFIKCAFYVPLWALARAERLARAVRTPRDNFYAVPGWLNRLLEMQIVWEDRLRLTRLAPFGVSILCAGSRPA